MGFIARGLRLALLGLGLAACSVCWGQASEVLRLVVPVPPGGEMDSTARLLAPHLAQRLQRSVVVDNRPGAGTHLGSEWVAHGPPDGRTLLMAGVSFATAAQGQALRYDPFADLRPVIQLTREHLVLAVRADLGPRTLQELAALLRAQPERLNCAASPGVAGFGCTLLNRLLGVRMQAIPFSGVAPMLTQLLGAQVDLAFIPALAAQQYQASGRLRLLGVASASRLRGALAPLPTLQEIWPGCVLDGYLGILVAGRTDTEQVAQLNAALNAVLADPEVQAGLRATQQEPVGGSPEPFARHIRTLHAHYERLADAPASP